MEAPPAAEPRVAATTPAGRRVDSFWITLLWAAMAIGAFHGAFSARWLGFLIGLFLFALVQISYARTTRVAFYVTLLAMMACYGPRLTFFWGIFGVFAVSLWGILAVWVAVFMLLARGLREQIPRWAWTMLLPVLWTGFEYGRCEWNPLRFTWLTPGFAVGTEGLLKNLGIYGSGMAAMALAAGLAFFLDGRRPAQAVIAVLAAFLVAAGLTTGLNPQHFYSGPPHHPLLVGVQLEDATPKEIVAALDGAAAAHPDAALFVLGEYSLGAPPPPLITDWVRNHNTHLIIGGMQPAEGKIASENDYYDTAFVIGPEGKIIFTQAKCVPIQVMHDGLAATQQRLWDSPWGKIGICICYDLSYRRVTDALIRQGAQLLIVPSMDAAGWGKQEHELHALVAPVRAAEYQVPIFRVCTSGISQYVAAGGAVEASAPFPGQGAVLASEVRFAGTRFTRPARIPLDQYLAPAAAIASAAAAAFVLVARMFRRIQRGLTLRGNAKPHAQAP